MTFFGSMLSWFGLAPRDPRVGVQAPNFGINQSRKDISFDAAMMVGAVFACTRLLSETIASLPLTMYTTKEDGTPVQVTDHQLIKLLKHKPNSRQTRIEFFETFMMNLVNGGNVYCLRGKGFSGDLVSLKVINTGSVLPILQLDGTMTYDWYQSNGEVKTFKDSDIWHVKLFGSGITGLSPLAAACQSIGVSLDAANRISYLMGKQSPPGALFAPAGKNPTKEQRDVLRTETQNMVTGDSIPVFPDGYEFKALQMTPAELELISTLRFSLEDIARIYGVPSVLINDSSQSTVWGTGIGSIVDSFYKFNLRPYLEKIELSLKINLLDPSEWDKYEFTFDFDAILRASKKDRMDMYKTQVMYGLSTPNECRIAEGNQPLAGGDNLLIPSNLMLLSDIGKIVPSRTQVDPNV